MAWKPYPIVSQDGREIRVRYLTPDDGDLLVDLVQRLSSESRYQRFHVSMEGVPIEEIRQRLPPFLDVDGVDSVALLAVVDDSTGERAIAVARYRRRPGETEAEAAVVVRDDWQRQGIGAALMRQLVAAARAQGIVRFTAMIQADNRAVHAMVKSLGVPYESHIDRAEDYIVMHIEEMPL